MTRFARSRLLVVFQNGLHEGVYFGRRARRNHRHERVRAVARGARARRRCRAGGRRRRRRRALGGRLDRLRRDLGRRDLRRTDRARCGSWPAARQLADRGIRGDGHYDGRSHRNGRSERRRGCARDGRASRRPLGRGRVGRRPRRGRRRQPIRNPRPDDEHGHQHQPRDRAQETRLARRWGSWSAQRRNLGLLGRQAGDDRWKRGAGAVGMRGPAGGRVERRGRGPGRYGADGSSRWRRRRDKSEGRGPRNRRDGWASFQHPPSCRGW
jgi:hypothetical protein